MGCVRTVSLCPSALRTVVVRNGLRTIRVNTHGLRTIVIPRSISLRSINLSESFLARVRVTIEPISNGVARAVALRPVFVRPARVVRLVFVRPIRVRRVRAIRFC